MTRNNADFHGVTISHTANKNMAAIVASHPEYGDIGYLELMPENSKGLREVANLWVTKEHQRKGIATAMWNHAVTNGLNPEHSRHQTEDAKAWVRSLK